MDWDFDGNLDILSGCYWTDGEDGAHLQILKGKGEMDFEKAASVTNVAGKPLQNVAIDGNDDPNLTCAICTEQHVVDYDGDGDLDVVMGCFNTNLYLYENVATESEKTEIAEEPQEIKIPGEAPGFYHSAPHLVDWDGDGDLDLLTGSGTGGVLISENVGTRKKPSWTQYEQLVPPSQFHEQFGDEEIKMGPSTRIWATDFNKDGVLDLLVGDSTSIVTPKEGLTKEEWKEKRDSHQKEMAELGKSQQKVMERYQEYANNEEEVPEELEEEMEELNGKLQKLFMATSKFQSQKRTGHVWVLIRKSDDKKTPRGSDVSQTGAR